MKRVNNIIIQAAEPDNLRLAFWKAQKGKTYAQQVQLFRQNLDSNLIDLREQLLSGQVEVGDYRYFRVFDPKEREICASVFPEQVIHHALMNICHAHFEEAQIYHSYASRPAKGVHAALAKAKQFTRPKSWFLKLDVRKFFASIPHDVLKAQLERLFKDYRLLNIFDKIIDSYHASPGRGLPIGNLSSQYFANHFLTGLDHFIKENLRCKAYVRYMDDMVLWHSDKKFLKEAKRVIESYVENTLQCSLKPALLNKAERGLPFCGYLIRPGYVRLSQRSKKRYIKKMENLQVQFDTGRWSEEVCHRRALPLIAFTEYAEAKLFRKKVMEGRTNLN